MVLLLPEQKSFGGEMARSLGENLGQGFLRGREEYQRMGQEKLQKQKINDFGKSLGIENLGDLDPSVQKEIISKTLQGMNEEKKMAGKESFLQRLSGRQQTPREQGFDQSQGEMGFNPLNLTESDIIEGENLGIRGLGQLRDTALRQKSENQKTQQHEKEFFHKESKKYDETLSEQSIAAEKKNRALESQLKLAHKLGKWDRVVSALAGQSKWGSLLKSTSAQEFDSYALPQMEGLRQVLGGVLSDSDIRLIMQKVVTSDKTPEANEKIAKYLMSENNLLLGKKQIADELKRNNGGYRPANYDSEINRIFNERYGNQIKSEFQELMSLPDDPKKLNQVGRRQVPPGTQLSENAIKMYFELANGDPVKATELAEEDGYDLPK